MAPEFVARTGGSRWQSALPTGSRWQSALPTGGRWGRFSLPASAVPTSVFRGNPENRRIRELEFVVPEFVDRTRGSKWQSALPTGSKWNRALPGWEGENE